MAEDERIVAYVERDMEEIIPFFMEDSKEEIQGLTQALENGDYDTLKSYGHKIKGSSVTCSEGFRAMSNIGLAIETAAKARKPLEEIRALVDQYIHYVNTVEIVYVEG